MDGRTSHLVHRAQHGGEQTEVDVVILLAGRRQQVRLCVELADGLHAVGAVLGVVAQVKFEIKL